ncbi:MAG: peptide ABC transporter substrate-binding protein [Phycisphaeraceae bacterium]|nr:peptide ABC transporter substrate-binding protein [Phycisphaeraceae bacterium]
MARLFIPLAMLAALLAVVVATDRPQPRADFVFVSRGDVSTLDPQRMSWMQDLRLGRLLYEGLVRPDVFTSDQRVVPGVAERWEVSEDGLTYTFHLRDTARWSNGEPVRAGDFVFSWRRALLPDTGSDYVKMFENISGAGAFLAWRTDALRAFDPARDDADRLWRETCDRFDQTVAVKAIDERTLQVGLARRVPYFLELCGFPVFSPVYPPLLQAHEAPDPRTGRLVATPGWTKPRELVGNGPFILTRWRFKREIRFERSPTYWNRDEISVGSISMPTIEDANAMILAFDAGDVDWVTDVTMPYRGDMLAARQHLLEENASLVAPLVARGVDPIEIDRLLPADPRLNIHAFPTFGTYFYNFNCRPTLPDGRVNPFADPRVRRAFAMSVDKRRITDEIRRLGEPAASTLIPPGAIHGYLSPTGLPYDVQAARRLLAEAGYPEGKGFPSVELLFNRDAGHDVVAQAIARDWQRDLGVAVVLRQREVAVFREDVKKGNFMISRAAWYGDYLDPTTFLDVNRTGDGNNDRGYSSGRFDELLARAEREPDPQARYTLLSEAEAVLVEEDLPILPIHHYSLVYLFDAHRVSGITSHPRQDQDLSRIDILGDSIGRERALSLPDRGNP